jgi:hypothetical protein
MNEKINSKEITKKLNEEEFESFLKQLIPGGEDVFFRFGGYTGNLSQKKIDKIEKKRNQFDRNIEKLQDVDKIIEENPHIQSKGDYIKFVKETVGIDIKFNEKDEVLFGLISYSKAKSSQS